MKTIISILIMVNCIAAFSQKTEEEIKKYLFNNLSTLDPIEGIWSIETFHIKVLYNSQLANESDAENSIGEYLAILKEGSVYKVYYKNSLYNNSQEYFVSKGMPGLYFYYTYVNGIKHTVNAVLQNPFLLKYNYKMNSQAKEKDLMLTSAAKAIKESNTYKFDVLFDCILTKMFPTYSDYQNIKQ